MHGAVGEDRVGPAGVKAVDLSFIRTVDGARPRLRGPVGGRALAEDQRPTDPDAARALDPGNQPARTPHPGPAGAFGALTLLPTAVLNVGEPRPGPPPQVAPATRSL